MTQNEQQNEDVRYEYPAGHLNHLSDDESKALQEFKTLCVEDGCYIPSDSFRGPSHDDETLLRFLRARKFVPRSAFEQFKATETWRREQDLSGWYETIDVDGYEKTRVLYTHWTGRRDKRGIPLYVFRIGALDAKKFTLPEHTNNQSQDSRRLDPKLRRLFATYEHLVSFVFPLCSSVPAQSFPETPISQTCNIVDMTGVGLRQIWTLKDHLQKASELATAHFPETLGRTFIIGAPSFFPTIWGWLSRWFDPVTVAKIFVLAPSEVQSTLESFIEIEDIPKRYGGKLDWDFGDDPLLDSKILEIMRMKSEAARTLPKGPLRWERSQDGQDMEAHAVGTQSGQQRNEVVARISKSVFTSQFCTPT